MLTKQLVATLSRLSQANENLASCLETTDRVPPNGTPKERADEIAQRIKKRLIRAKQEVEEAAGLFVMYEELLSRSARERERQVD